MECVYFQDARFNQDIDKLTGYKTSSLLALPILNRDGEVVGVAEIMNKKGGTHFNARDESIFARYLTFCGIGIQNAQLFEMSVQEHIRNQVLSKWVGNKSETTSEKSPKKLSWLKRT